MRKLLQLRKIAKSQERNVSPSLVLALEARKVQDEINSGLQTAEAYSKLKDNATVEFLDEEQDIEQDNEEPMPELETNEPETTVQSSNLLSTEQPIESQSQSQSQVIEKPIDEEKINRTYLTVLRAEQVRNYARN